MKKIIQNARNLRKNATDAEKLLWSKLRARQLLNLKFNRQVPFPPYILDFYCEELSLAIELDGGQHNNPEHAQNDEKRSVFLNSKGVKILRFWNNDVLKNIVGVLKTIAREAPSPDAPVAHHPLPGEESSRRILIAEITAAHGIKGFVKLNSYTDNEELLEHPLTPSPPGRGWQATGLPGEGQIKLQIRHKAGTFYIASVDGITDRNAAERLRGTKLYIDRDLLPAPEDGAYYIEDLKGLTVIDQNGQIVGIVSSVENFGASDLLDIKPAHGGESFYLPLTEDAAIDLDKKEITLSVPEIV
jgi:adenine-specific DNA-methyltransferase